MDSFWSNIFRRNNEQERIRTVLKRIPVFEGLTRKELVAMERILYRREYKAGETIFHQGEPGIGMYIIESGRVQIYLEPTQQLLAELHDGDFFGELALMDDSPRSATVLTKTDCRMLAFFRSDLLDLIERKPTMGIKIVMKLMYVIGARLKKSNDQVTALQKKLYSLKQQRRNRQESE